MSRQLNLLEISTRMLRTTKNIEFYRVFDRNRPIETINGYDKRSTMDRFQKCRVRRIADGWSRCSLILRFKTRSITSVGSRSGGLDAIRAVSSGPL